MHDGAWVGIFGEIGSHRICAWSEGAGDGLSYPSTLSPGREPLQGPGDFCSMVVGWSHSIGVSGPTPPEAPVPCVW